MDLPTTRYDKVNLTESEISNNDEKIETKTKNKLEGLSFYILLIVLFIVPLAFIPSIYTSQDVVKTSIISFGVLLSVIIYSISTFKNRTLSLPKGAVAYSMIAIAISIILSTFNSSNFEKSFIGQGFEIGTASFLLLMILSSFFVARLVSKNKERMLNIYAAILLSSLVVIIFQVTRIILGAEFMTLGILSSVASTVVGKWYEFPILTAVVLILSYLGIKFLSLGKGLKSLLYVIFIGSGFILISANVVFIWYAIVIIFSMLLVYEYFSHKSQEKGVKGFFEKLSFLTLAVIIISILSIWNTGKIGSTLTKSLSLEQTEIYLPWQMTVDVASNTIKESPLLGAGPNRFVNQFLKFKPAGINPTQFWSVEFTTGFGTVPSFTVTQGILGFIAWILFLIFFTRYGILALKKTNDQFKKFAVTSSFLATAFLWLVNIVYTPSHVIIFFTFIFTGLFLSTLVSEGLMSYKVIPIDSNSKNKNYVSILLVTILVLEILWIGLYAKKILAVSYFHAGIKELNTTRSIETAEAKFNKALSLSRSDIYYQALSEIDAMKINDLASQLQKEQKDADSKISENIGKLVSEAFEYTNKAVAIDPTNYYNYTAQARISEIGAALKIPNALENAKTAYVNAITFNPYNPLLHLNIARLEASQNNLAEAQKFIGNALTLKQNYLDAIFLLSQIQVSNGQIKDAIVSTQVATQINPQNALLFFQLGFLQYNDKNYTDAVTSLQKAITLNDQYANAKYFLGLSYSRLGKNAEAIAQFEDLIKTNPESEEVKFILENLKFGKSPFADAQPPIDNKPEQRKSLPVKEKTSSTPSQKLGN